MCVLLDACVDPRVAGIIAGHEVRTAHQMGWHRLKDSALISLVQDQFDVLLTIDRGFEFEYNVKRLRFGIVIAHVEKNKLEFYQPLKEELLAVLERLGCGEVIHVGATSP